MPKEDIPKSKIESVISLFSNNKLQEALDNALSLIEDFPKDALLQNILGACYAGLDDLPSAVKSYNNAIILQPDYAKAHYNLGSALHDLGQFDESVKSYQVSLSIDPDYAQAHNNLGNVFKDIGNFDDAIYSYKSAILKNPDYLEAHYSLATVYQEVGEFDKSIEHLNRVISIDPNLAEIHNKLGDVLTELGQLDDAAKSYQKATDISSNYSEAHNNLGNTFKELGRLEDAIRSYKKAIKINPDFPALHNNLGNAFKELGQLEDAVESYQNGLKFNPDYPESLNNLGVALFETGKLSGLTASSIKRESAILNKAVKNFERAIEIRPDYVDVYLNLSEVLKHLGRYDDAVKWLQESLLIDNNSVDIHNSLGCLFKDMAILNKDEELLDYAVLSFNKALEINSNSAEVYNNLGNVQKDLKLFDDAVKSFESAISLNSDFATAHNNYGTLLAEDLFRFEDAIKSFDKAIEIEPEFIPAHLNLGHTFSRLLQYEDAINSYSKVRDSNPNLDNVLGNLLSAKMNCCNWDNLGRFLDEVKTRIEANEKVIDPFSLFGLIDDPELQRKTTELRVSSSYPKSNILPKIKSYHSHAKIRVGYFSGDFREHPVGLLTAELYELHNRENFEVHAFSLGPDTKDQTNLRIKAGVDHFHYVESMSCKEIAKLARSLEIDIAVDLAGLTGGAKTEIFAFSAAPLQINYLGYTGTMCADYYDYLIADKIVIPQNKQKYYSEKIAYLPGSYFVNDSKAFASDRIFSRKDLGLPEKGFIFCCLNNHFKIKPDVFNSWMKILLEVKGSSLWLAEASKYTEENLIKEAKKRGIDQKRLIFTTRLNSYSDHLSRIQLADLFLDTHPFNAHTSCYDALRIGLPVLTYKGESFVSRVASSLISAVNLPELITNSPKEYEALAIKLGNNPDKIKAIKEKLKANLSTAPLFDTKLFTKNIESAFTQMYERNQKGLETDHIYVD